MDNLEHQFMVNWMVHCCFTNANPSLFSATPRNSPQPRLVAHPRASVKLLRIKRHPFHRGGTSSDILRATWATKEIESYNPLASRISPDYWVEHGKEVLQISLGCTGRFLLTQIFDKHWISQNSEHVWLRSLGRGPSNGLFTYEDLVYGGSIWHVCWLYIPL